MLRANIRGQQDQGVAEIDPPPLAIGEMPFIQDLQQNVENIGMRFFNFIKQDDLIRAAADGFGQTAAIFIADIPGRRPDQTRDRVLFHIFRHIHPQNGLGVIEQRLRQ